jgi:hypothetical protein
LNAFAEGAWPAVLDHVGAGAVSIDGYAPIGGREAVEKTRLRLLASL